jgi:predicted nucleic acid-binding protein
VRVFDTSVLLGALERREAPARRALLGELVQAEAGGDLPAVSALTVGEVLRGAANEQDAGRLLALLAPFQVLDLGPEEAKMAGALGAAADSRDLPRRRRPGPADMLIAGTAALHGAELVTCDGEFEAFPDSVRITILPGADH